MGVIRVAEPSRKHKFHSAIVAGISKDMNKSQVRDRSKISTFIKVMNQIHMMPTRYKIKMDLGNVSYKWCNPKDGRKSKLRKKIKSKLTRMYFKNSKPSTRWFFKKLYF